MKVIFDGDNKCIGLQFYESLIKHITERRV
jgi:hypothetical protein